MLRDNLVGSSQTMTKGAALIDFDASLPPAIGSKDPDALKIPARRAESSLTGNCSSPFQAEPRHMDNHLHGFSGDVLITPAGTVTQ